MVSSLFLRGVRNEDIKINYVNGKQATQVEKKEKRTRKENLSTRDIEDLMGIHGPRYERRRGVIRQK